MVDHAVWNADAALQARRVVDTMVGSGDDGCLGQRRVLPAGVASRS